MPLARSFPIAAMTLTLAAYATLSTAASPMRPGLWELRVATIVGGTPVPASTSRACLAQKDIDDDTKTLPQPNGDCQLSNIATVGNHTMYDLVCKVGDTTSRGRMDLTIEADSYDGKSDMVFSGVGSEEIPISVVVHAMRVGDCAK